MKKVVLIIMAVTMIATLGIAAAQANSYVVTVKYAGVGGTSGYVMLSDTAATPAFTNRWFTLNSAVMKEQLATALTAASNGFNVYAGFAGTTTPAAYSVVTTFYVIP
jgi:hypothetical protein